jgi:uncharacterized protein (TIGR02145 family)
MKYVKALLSFLIFLLVACSNDAVSSHEVVPIAGDVSSSAVTTSSSSREIVEHSCSSSAEKLSSAEESSSSSELLSSSDESVESSSSSVLQESSSSSAQEESSSSKEYIFYGEMTDERDGQKYRTITFIYEDAWIKVSKTWLAENLNYAYLQPTTTLDSSSWCYNNDPDNCAKYGRLYLWSAVMDSAGVFGSDAKSCGYFPEADGWYRCNNEKIARGVCPENWHVPYEDELDLPMWSPNLYAGIYYPNSLLSPEWNGYADNTVGFDIMPAGYYDSHKAIFSYVGEEAYLWFSTEKYSSYAIGAKFPYSEMERRNDPRLSYQKYAAFSVRCVKDEEVEE